MSQPSLSLVVLQTATLHSVVAFYRTVGLKFVEEKHGNGPIHYACALGTTVIEIYPGKDGAAPSAKNGGATMLGFRVDALDEVLAALREIGAVVLSPPHSTEWGRRAVVRDPDGRSIELTELARPDIAC